MSDNNLRFPTGVTIAQAKKDAKKHAKQTVIPLNQALDKMVQNHGINAGWSSAVATLKKRGEPLGVFQLPLRDGQSNSVIIYPDAPFVTIVGASGTGKTVLALELGQQALAQDLAVDFYSFKLAREHDGYYERDLGSQMAQLKTYVYMSVKLD